MVIHRERKKKRKRSGESLKIQSDKHSVSNFKSKDRNIRGSYLWDYVKVG